MHIKNRRKLIKLESLDQGDLFKTNDSVYMVTNYINNSHDMRGCVDMATGYLALFSRKFACVRKVNNARLIIE